MRVDAFPEMVRRLTLRLVRLAWRRLTFEDEGRRKEATQVRRSCCARSTVRKARPSPRSSSLTFARSGLAISAQGTAAVTCSAGDCRPDVPSSVRVREQGDRRCLQHGAWTPLPVAARDATAAPTSSGREALSKRNPAPRSAKYEAQTLNCLGAELGDSAVRRLLPYPSGSARSLSSASVRRVLLRPGS